MAEIVAVALTSHTPLMTANPTYRGPSMRIRFYAGFHEIQRRLAARGRTSS